MFKNILTGRKGPNVQILALTIIGGVITTLVMYTINFIK